MTELTCLLCFSFFLCFLSSCLCLICLASSMLYRDALSMYRPGCWCWCGTSAVPASRVRKPRGCYCPRTCDAKSSRGLVCIFLFPSRCLPLSLSLSFIHHSLYIAGMPKLMRTRCTHKPSGLAVGEAHVPHSGARTNTRTHNCFPAK